MIEPVKKIILITSGPVQITRMPAAGAFLAGICQSENVDYDIVDLNAEIKTTLGEDLWEKMFIEEYQYNSQATQRIGSEYDEIARNFFRTVCAGIQEQRYDAIAVSVLSFVQHGWTKLFLEQCQHICPDIQIIVGGPGVTTTYKIENSSKISFGRYLVDNDLADYFVLGEGDILFRKFLLGQAEGMPGFNCKNTPDTWQPQIDDLDQTPIPSYKKFNLDHYDFYNNEPEITLTASRGCVRKCTFCDIGYHWKKFRFRAGSRVVDEMYKGYSDMGVTKFWFNDSLINGSYKQFFDFLECLQRKQSQDAGFSKITYGGQLILRNQTHHSSRMYELMGATGGRYFQVGVESGSEAVRNHMQKKFSNEDIYYHYEMCRQFNISNWIFMTVGYPTETEKDFQDTLDLLTNLQRYLINDIVVGVGITSIDILENTPLATMVDELDLVYLHNESNADLYLKSTYGQSKIWQSRDQEGLNQLRKYVRWTKLARHVLNLGYRVSREFYMFIMNRLQTLERLDQEKIKPVIPIAQILS